MKMTREIEFRSDTLTKPTLEMRKAMFEAVVGDDGYGLDPTVKELEQLGAKMLGKEEGLYFPSGVMGNLASVMSHCWERGQEILVGDLSHIVMYEQGGVSTLANIHSRSIRNTPDGCFDISELEFKIRPTNDVHQPRTALVCIENTHNRCAGAALPIDFIHNVRNVAKSYNLKTHVDGARIFNASIASGVPVSDIVQGYDSVSICLSKGLGCPIGNLVVGSSDFMTRLRRSRKVLGGQMRQVGVIAAAGIVALNSMVERLADDHKHARLIAEAVSSLQSDAVSVNMKRVQTNIVFLDVNPHLVTVQQFCQRFREVTEEEKSELGEDVCIMNVNPFGPGVCRILTHADVSYEEVLLAIKKIKFVMNELEKHPPKSNGATNGTNGHSNGHHAKGTNGYSNGVVGYQ